MNLYITTNEGILKSTKFRIIVLLVLWAAAFFPVYPDLIHTWLHSSNNSHGILAPLISAFFVWQRRDKLRSAIISNSNWGAVILMFSMAFYVISYAGHIDFTSRVMIILSLSGIILFTLGETIFKLLRFPLFFLIFMVPIPDSVVSYVAFPLQLFATKASSLIIKGVCIPVYREGNMLYFAQTQLETAEACSGIRSLVALTMLSTIFAHLFRGRRVFKSILILSAVPLAIISNITRVSGTGILAHFYGAKVARGFLHEFSGLAVFAFGIIMLSILYVLLNKIGSKR